MNNKVYQNMLKHNNTLSKYACKDEEAVPINGKTDDIRTPFFKDIDRIIYSLSYARYTNKTQVFTINNNDHIQTRMLHVQFVSKIARTIGRALNLNEDLIEAAALGHDLGHTPFGHEGERILNKISLELTGKYFMHNVNSVRNLLYIENHGKGLNISLQVLDAIMCHNGEIVSNEYYPKPKTERDFFEEFNGTYYSLDTAKYLRPMTLEGCVVRISDLIAYLGRDIEDGRRMGLVSFNTIPDNIKHVLGTTNSEIVNTIVLDLIHNSLNKNYLALSDEVYEAMKELKDFNYKYIYSKSLTEEQKNFKEYQFRFLAKTYIKDIEQMNLESSIYKSFLINMDDEYIKNNSKEQIVIDYIAGMTDDYFEKQFALINENSK